MLFKKYYENEINDIRRDKKMINEAVTEYLNLVF